MQLKSFDPVRINLGPGAVAICDPIQPHDYMRAKGQARDLVLGSGEGEPHDLHSRYRCALIGFLVHRPDPDAPPERLGGLRTLEGVADVDGSPIEGQPTAEQIDRLLGWYPAYEAFERQYAGPLLEAEAEKTACRPRKVGVPPRGRRQLLRRMHHRKRTTVRRLPRCRQPTPNNRRPDRLVGP